MIFVRISFGFNSCCVILIEWTFIVIHYCNICSLILSVKLENGLKEHIRNVAEIKYGFVKLAVIFLTFYKITLFDSFPDYPAIILHSLMVFLFPNSNNFELRIKQSLFIESD